MIRQELYTRGGKGFEIYAKGMDNSMLEKAKLLPFVKPGTIAELGCGNGAVLELLSKANPESEIIGVDLSTTLLDLAASRRYEGKVELVQDNILRPVFEENSVDTVVLSSVLHEVYSYNNYEEGGLHRVLDLARTALRPGGRLIIRDGVKPENKTVYLMFKNEETRERFYRFAEEFGHYAIPYQNAAEFVRLSLPDANEFLTKYFYTANWDIEVKEHFGFWTAQQHREALREHGMVECYSYSYLIDWLRENKYERDAQLFDKKLQPMPFPESTLIMVAEVVA